MLGASREPVAPGSPPTLHGNQKPRGNFNVDPFGHPTGGPGRVPLGHSLDPADPPLPGDRGSLEPTDGVEDILVDGPGAEQPGDCPTIGPDHPDSGAGRLRRPAPPPKPP